MNYVPIKVAYSRDHTDSQYYQYMGVDRKGTELIGNKQTYENIHTYIYIYIHTYICEGLRRCFGWLLLVVLMLL